MFGEDAYPDDPDDFWARFPDVRDRLVHFHERRQARRAPPPRAGLGKGLAMFASFPDVRDRLLHFRERRQARARAPPPAVLAHVRQPVMSSSCEPLPAR